MAYKALQGQVECFSSVELHKQKVNILSSCHVTQPSDTNLVWQFTIFKFSKKKLYLALLRLMDCCEQQQSQLVQICGL